MSKMHNRVYALAREAGKKAAIWIRQEHSDLFQHKVADPEIKVRCFKCIKYQLIT